MPQAKGDPERTPEQAIDKETEALMAKQLLTAVQEQKRYELRTIRQTISILNARAIFHAQEGNTQAKDSLWQLASGLMQVASVIETEGTPAEPGKNKNHVSIV